MANKPKKVTQQFQVPAFHPRTTFMYYAVKWACEKIGEEWRAKQALGS